jgi:hypothetical protein
MSLLADFIKYEIVLILTAFLVVVVFQMLTGRINMERLLYDKTSNTISPSRIQQLIFTLIAALYYLFLSYKNPGSFPEIPESLLYMMGGSSLFYLGSKARTLLAFFTKK